VAPQLTASCVGGVIFLWWPRGVFDGVGQVGVKATAWFS